MFLPKKSFRLYSVDLGTRKIKVPVFDTLKKESGKTVLITAGMDGDEYTGIEAGYRLIERYKKSSFYQRLIIIPLVNILGFEQGISFNPMDLKFPKFLYSDNKKGSESEKLYSFLLTFVYQSQFWFDLHSGASSESLNPFVWAYETNNKKLDEMTKKLISHLSDYTILYEKGYDQKRVDDLKKRGIEYMVLESGDLGKIEKKDINRHVKAIETLLSVLKNQEKKIKKPVLVYRRFKAYNAKSDGLWRVNGKKQKIKKGDVMGTLYSFTNEVLQVVKAKEDGYYLWGKHLLSCKKGDTLLGMAYEIEEIS